MYIHKYQISAINIYQLAALGQVMGGFGQTLTWGGKSTDSEALFRGQQQLCAAYLPESSQPSFVLSWRQVEMKKTVEQQRQAVLTDKKLSL